MITDYELARQLKDAGFPQTYHYDDQGRRIDFREPEVVALPTIAELIEECGENPTFTLSKPFPPRPRPHEVWYAKTSREVKSQEWKHWEGEGSTPEEAVAHLWLALHVHGDATA